MFKEHTVCPMLTLTHFKIFPSKYIMATTLTTEVHVTSPVTWPFDTPGAISYRCSNVTKSVSPAIFKIIGPILGVTALTFLSRDVINCVTNRSAICHFLLVSHWSQVSIFNSIRDICTQIYLGHDLDLSGSRDVTNHVIIWYCRCHFL